MPLASTSTSPQSAIPEADAAGTPSGGSGSVPPTMDGPYIAPVAPNGVCAAPPGARLVRLLLASGCEDKTVRLWDVARGVQEGPPLVGHEGWVTSVAMAVCPLSGRLLVASGSWDRTVRLWDAVTHTPLGEPLSAHEGPVSSVAFGRSPVLPTLLLAAGSWDGTVAVWDAVSRRRL